MKLTTYRCNMCCDPFDGDSPEIIGVEWTWDGWRPWLVVDAADCEKHLCKKCVKSFADIWTEQFARSAVSETQQLAESAKAMDLLLRMLRSGVAKFDTKHKEILFNGRGYSATVDWVTLMDAIGWEKAEKAVQQAEGK